MTIRRKLSERLFDGHGVSSPSQIRRKNSMGSSSLRRKYLSPPDSNGSPVFRRFLQQRAIYQFPSKSRVPEFLSLPIGEKLKEKLSEIHISKDRLQEKSNGGPISGISVKESRKIVRILQMERLKAKLRNIAKSSISYSEFMRLCEKEDQGIEFAKTIDESGGVIVLGNLVFLRLEQVARSVGTIISESTATVNDPRIKELEDMEEQKSVIDQKAQAHVRTELYCGMGLILGQTIGLMRLTFWDLSWDVMEPICFFLTSLYFAVGYGFFIKTSTEPSFEGYSRRRFESKQAKLMDIYNFDIHKYNQLRERSYPFSK